MATPSAHFQNFEDKDAEQRNVKKEAVDWAQIDRRQQALCFRSSFHTSCALVAMTGSVLFGWNTAVLNTAGDHIASELGWCGSGDLRVVDCTAAQLRKTLISTSVFIGAALSAVFTGFLSAQFGIRRVTLNIMAVFAFGIVSACCANSFSALFAARFIIGIAVGMISGLCPNYIAEMVPAFKRGRFGVLHQIVICSAQLLCIVLGLVFTPIPDANKDPSTTYVPPLRNKIWWRLLIGLALLPVALSVLFYGWVVSCETPKYYARRNNLEDAELLLKRVYNGGDVTAALENIVSESLPNEDREEGSHSLWQARYRSVILVGVMVAAFQQLTGINAFVVNSTTLFKDVGFSSEAATNAAILTVASGVIFTFIPLFLLDKVGRRILLLIGASGMSCSVLPATIYYWSHWTDQALTTPDSTENRLAGILALSGAIGFMLFYAISIGPITWIYIVEIFPLEIKDEASSICVCTNWLSATIMVFLSGLISTKWCYSIFSVSSIVFLIFCLLFVKETKGLALGDTPYRTTHRAIAEGTTAVGEG